jgi:hypothetical protein
MKIRKCIHKIHLVPRYRKVEVYLRFFVRHHGLALNLIKLYVLLMMYLPCDYLERGRAQVTELFFFSLLNECVAS